MMDERKIDNTISKLLHNGIIFSGLSILLGWVLSFNESANQLANLQNYQKRNLFLTLEMEVLAGNWALLVCYAGLFALICLPVLRVFVSMILLLKQKEKGMALISSLVLLGLLMSFTFGIEI